MPVTAISAVCVVCRVALGPIPVSVAAVALILAAAKAHGRQLRLERESHGFMSVDFRRDNAPWVEALWRRDRLGFWPAFVVLAVGSSVWLRPDLSRLADWGPVALAWACAFAAAFTLMGLWSLARFLRSGRGEAEWRRSAEMGSLGWWTLVAALGGAVAALTSFA